MMFNEIFYSIDYDGCVADPLIENLIIDKLKRDLELYPEAIFYLMIGSMRQSARLDKKSWEKFNNGSCFIFFDLFIRKIKKKFPNDAHRLHLDKFLLEDLAQNVKEGTSFKNALKFIKSTTDRAQIDPEYAKDTLSIANDRYKRDIILAQIYRTATRHNDLSKLRLMIFFDDVEIVLSELHDYFINYNFILPITYKLTLYLASQNTLKLYGSVIGIGRCLNNMSFDSVSRKFNHLCPNYIIQTYIDHLVETKPTDTAIIEKGIECFTAELPLFANLFIFKNAHLVLLPFIKKNNTSRNYEDFLYNLLYQAIQEGHIESMNDFLIAGITNSPKILNNYQPLLLAAEQIGANELSKKELSHKMLHLFATHAVHHMLQKQVITVVLDHLLLHKEEIAIEILRFYNGPMFVETVNGGQYEGYSILHLAIEFEFQELIKLIIKKDQTFYKSTGKTTISAWELACLSNNKQLYQLITPKIQHMPFAFEIALKCQRFDVCHQLFDWLIHDIDDSLDIEAMKQLETLFITHNRQDLIVRLKTYHLFKQLEHEKAIVRHHSPCGHTFFSKTEATTLDSLTIDTHCAHFIQKIRTHLQVDIPWHTHQELRLRAFDILMLWIISHGQMDEALVDRWLHLKIHHPRTKQAMTIASVLTETTEWHYTQFTLFGRGYIPSDIIFIRGVYQSPPLIDAQSNKHPQQQGLT